MSLRLSLVLAALTLLLAGAARADAPVALPLRPALEGADAANEPEPTSLPTARELRHMPLAGFTDQTAFIRSPDNTFQLFPNGRLQLDYYAFKRDTPKMPFDGFAVKRARLELFGWIGPHFGFNIAGDFAAAVPGAADPVAQSNLNSTDDFILVAPLRGSLRDTVLVQLGQFDAPFTLENRTSDKYFDFIERSFTVRALGIPSNKELGLMVHGLLPNQSLYYSLGVFDGDGQNFKNSDSHFDLMGRAWVAPFALAEVAALKHVTIGGSFWYGDRVNALPLAAQTTAAGFKLLDPTWKNNGTPMELHQNGTIQAYAFELNAPIAHRGGVRLEYVWKKQGLGEYDTTTASSSKWLGGSQLKGYSLYGQAWFWLMGDDTIVGEPGLQLPPRFTRMGQRPPRHGLQLLVRLEHLDETIASDVAADGNPLVGHTTVTSTQVGLTYWYTKRFRMMLNYDWNVIGGTAPAITGPTTSGVTPIWSKLGWGHYEHEVLLRAAIAL